MKKQSLQNHLRSIRLIQFSSWKRAGEGELCLCSSSRRRNQRQRLWDVSVHKQQTRRRKESSFTFQRFRVASERLLGTMNSMMFISVLIHALIRLNGQRENSWERRSDWGLLLIKPLLFVWAMEDGEPYECWGNLSGSSYYYYF